ncbi:MAG: TatD family hydrolase, partial [Armatimonadota bacterium]
MTLVDTHCHPNHRELSRDIRGILRRAKEAGVDRMVCASYDLESSEKAVSLAREFTEISAAIGIHPHDAATMTPEAETRLTALASEAVAIGETGLDYYRDFSPRQVQQEAFRRHIALANTLDLPLVVHSRDAQADVLAILEAEGLPARGVVMHCLPTDAEFAREALRIGCFVGIAGTITFKNAEALREIVRGLPLDRLLLETDAPYLAPHPYRGQ